MKKKLLKLVIYILTVVHIVLLFGIFYYDNKYHKIKEKEIVELEKYRYDNKPLTVKINNEIINLNTVDIEIGKILEINNKVVFEIENVKEVNYRQFDSFLLLIFKDEKDFNRLVFIDSYLNVIKEIRGFNEDDEVFNIIGDDSIKLYEDTIIINMDSANNTLVYKLTWKDIDFFESVDISKRKDK